MALGHLVLSFPDLFYMGLACVALGNGLFLPSLPSQISALYAADDPRQSGAYNVSYVGVNVGGFIAPLVCGTLGELFGWPWVSGPAPLAMRAGLPTFWGGGAGRPHRQVGGRG